MLCLLLRNRHNFHCEFARAVTVEFARYCWEVFSLSVKERPEFFCCLSDCEDVVCSYECDSRVQRAARSPVNKHKHLLVVPHEFSIAKVSYVVVV